MVMRERCYVRLISNDVSFPMEDLFLRLKLKDKGVRTVSYTFAVSKIY